MNDTKFELTDEIRTMIESYKDTALWTEEGIFRDYLFLEHEKEFEGEVTLSDNMKRLAVTNCINFVQLCREESLNLMENGPEDAGHYLWLNSNRHGAGFWDGQYTDGEALSEAAHGFSVDCYVDEDGIVQV